VPRLDKNSGSAFEVDHMTRIRSNYLRLNLTRVDLITAQHVLTAFIATLFGCDAAQRAVVAIQTAGNVASPISTVGLKTQDNHSA
jgi:hypothetical protein